MKRAAREKQLTAGFLRFVLLLALLCNGFDAWYTLSALTLAETAREVNPWIALLLERCPPLFMAYKFVLTTALLYLLYRLRRSRSARAGLCFCAAFYYGNTLYQLLTMYHWW